LLGRNLYAARATDLAETSVRQERLPAAGG
jgi:hypothetical protein